MNPAEPLVNFRAVTKRYGDGPPVLADISFAVGRGEFVSFIGPSGCGKSTLLRLIAGLSPVTAGALTVDGRAPEAARGKMAFVFQEATLLPWLTVAKNVELPQRIRGEARAARRTRAAEMLALVGLGDAGGLYPRQLSGGMKMRVSIARALTLEPEILLLDEPFGALDELARDRLNEELLALREQRRFTAFYVTHSVSEAVFLSSRILVLAARPGRIAHDLAVSRPYPRAAAVRDEPEFHRQTAEVSRRLRAVAEGAA